MKPRTVLRITGPDAQDFLQGLVSNDLGRLATGPVYAALLTPQGKYLADFFLTPDEDHIILDVAEDLAPGLLQRLSMYKLRSKVEIEPTEMIVSRGIGPAPDGALPDPRHSALGWRLVGPKDVSEAVDWDAIRVEHVIPETDIELTQDSYLLESGFERLNGVDFRKGCYVGQEVTVRMKHKTELRKGLVQVDIDGTAPVGAPLMIDGKEAGTLYTQSGGKALAFLRFDRASGPMTAGDATVTWAV